MEEFGKMLKKLRKWEDILKLLKKLLKFDKIIEKILWIFDESLIKFYGKLLLLLKKLVRKFSANFKVMLVEFGWILRLLF